jgi:hypothetical protein
MENQKYTWNYIFSSKGNPKHRRISLSMSGVEKTKSVVGNWARSGDWADPSNAPPVFYN